MTPLVSDAPEFKSQLRPDLAESVRLLEIQFRQSMETAADQTPDLTPELRIVLVPASRRKALRVYGAVATLIRLLPDSVSTPFKIGNK